MQADLYSMAYFSRSTLAADPEVQHAEIRQILAASRRNNVRCGVTGALLFSQGCFAQVLEGSRQDVDRVFERVRQDPRHAGVLVIYQGPIAERSFGGWWMAYAGPVLAGEAGDGQPEGVSGPQDILTTQSGRQLLTRLRDMIEREERVSAPKVFDLWG